MRPEEINFFRFLFGYPTFNRKSFDCLKLWYQFGLKEVYIPKIYRLELYISILDLDGVR